MEFMEVIRKRRSIRKYKPDPVPDEILDEILDAARLAPSAGNREPWHFIVVRDAETKHKLGVSSWALEAPILIVGCVDFSVSSRYNLVDFGIAFEHIVLAAADFGLGTCWMGFLGFDVEIKKLLEIPENVKVVAVTPIGYPAEEPGPKTRKTLAEIVHEERF